MKISNCQTNHLHAPLGYAMEHAVVSWITESTESTRQKNAQITVASDPDMQNILYCSDPLTSPDSTGLSASTSMFHRK